AGVWRVDDALRRGLTGSGRHTARTGSARMERPMAITVFPRFSEVDVLGHVTNTALPVWFEEGRQEIFRHFSRETSMRDLTLILRRYEIDFLQQ
ncbi:hypothetical protein LB456_13715, partial [Psychroflexus sp. CAK57W]|uniref:hypothetical protein n=1 Tax=Psychroflexus curvus TaxID=2873595 RepID=UPI001CC9156D